MANAEEEEKEKENKQPPGAPRKEHPTWEMELTLLLMLMRLSQPDPMTPMTMMMYSQTLRELCEMRWKVKERKEWLWQLLSQRSGE